LNALRIICLFAFSVSALAGLGVDYLNANQTISLRKKIRKKVIICIVFILVFYLAWNFSLLTKKDYIIEKAKQMNYAAMHVGTPDFHILILNFFNALASNHEGYLRYYSLCSPTICVPIFLFIASAILFSIYKTTKKIFFKSFLILIIIVDLFYFGMRFNATVDKKFLFPRLESVEFLKKDKEIYRVSSIGRTFMFNTLMPYKIQSLGGCVALFSKRYDEFLRLIGKQGDNWSYIITDYNSKLLDLLNVKYFLMAGDDKADQEFKGNNKFKLVYDKDIHVYENKTCMERAFFVSDFKVIKKKEDIYLYCLRLTASC